MASTCMEEDSQGKELCGCWDQRLATDEFSQYGPPKGSAVWNFILDCRFVITNHISWQGGNGSKANFWEDSWNSLSVLKDNVDLHDLQNFFLQVWGDKLTDYVEMKHGIGGRE